MRRSLFAVSTGALLALGVTSASADPELGTNPADQQAAMSQNCVAYYSALFIRNGLSISSRAAQGERGTEIKSLQDECNKASETSPQ